MESKQKTMELRPKYKNSSEYFSELTEMLDKDSSITKNSAHDFYRHYILADDWSLNERCLAIRLPGRTWGGIRINSDMVIQDIVLDTVGMNTGKKPYPDELLENIKQFIGCKIIFIK